MTPMMLHQDVDGISRREYLLKPCMAQDAVDTFIKTLTAELMAESDCAHPVKEAPK